MEKDAQRGQKSCSGGIAQGGGKFSCAGQYISSPLANFSYAPLLSIIDIQIISIIMSIIIVYLCFQYREIDSRDLNYKIYTKKRNI